MKINKAIISVFNKKGLEELGLGLKEFGVEVFSTGKSFTLLKDSGINIKEVSALTGFPEILDGRVKTLHPKVHAGILADREKPDHLETLQEHEIDPIDLVVINLYPFAEVAANPKATENQIIEMIDIGGPTMIRAAAKNFKSLCVIVDPEDYSFLLEELRENKGETSLAFRRQMAAKAFRVIAEYDQAIDAYFKNTSPLGGEGVQFSPPKLTKAQTLRYGENPHQQASFYKEENATEPSISTAKQLHGKELSYNNILDADAAIEMIKEFDQTACVIVKHTNPCGAAVSDSLSDAFELALSSDSLSAFGGIVAFNCELDLKAAEKISKVFFEIVAAPSFQPDALKLLTQKKNLRLLEVPRLDQAFQAEGSSWRKVVGGLLVQDRDLVSTTQAEWKVVTRKEPSQAEWRAAEFSWKLAKHIKSNAIVFATEKKILGVGAGQMSRLDSVYVANMKMENGLQALGQEKPEKFACASDAFFPFPDGVELSAKAGATTIIQPGGSVKDAQVIEAANKLGLAMIFTGQRHFRH